MIKRKFIWFYLLLAVVIMAVGCAEGDSEATDETVKIPVTISKAEAGVVRESFLALGSIEPQISISIDAGGNGTVEKLYVETGDREEAGDKLFLLDADNLERNFNTTESQLRTIRDNLYIQFLDLQETLSNQELLYTEGAISKIQLDQTRVLWEQLRRQYLDASTAYDNQVKNIQEGIDDRTAVSPISGKIAVIFIKENETINGSVAMKIIDDDFVVAIASVTSEQINKMVIGGSAVIYPDGKLLGSTEGQVSRFNELPDDGTGLYEVEVEIANQEHKLRSGEYVEIDFIIDERDALMIPKQAVRTFGENQVVFVIVDGRAQQRVVDLGTEQGEMIEVIEGLTEEDQVVVKGAGYLREGSEVLILTAK